MTGLRLIAVIMVPQSPHLCVCISQVTLPQYIVTIVKRVNSTAALALMVLTLYVNGELMGRQNTT